MLWLIPLAWLVFGLVGPVRLRGEINRHNSFAVWLTAEAKGGNHQPSVIHQEVGEWRLHKLIGVAFGLAMSLALPSHPFTIAAVFAATVLSDAISRKVKQIDWAGHGAEVLHAERAGIEGYRVQEAARVARDYDATVADALEWFDQWRWLSRVIGLLARW